MTNPYFDSGDWTQLSNHTLGRAQGVNDMGSAVEAGFDLLPDPDVLNEGRVTYAADTGAANALVVALPETLTSYTAGLSILVKVAAANTGAATINVDSVGAKAIKQYDGGDLASGDLVVGQIAHLVYDGTNFVLVGVHGSVETAAAASATAAAASETAAAASQTAAAASATAAAASETAAASSQTAAAASQTAAAASQTAAAASATAASASETAAASSESNASTHAGTASTQATAAAASASGASTSATNASSSETAAAASQTAAAASATAAAASETAAAASATSAAASAAPAEKVSVLSESTVVHPKTDAVSFYIADARKDWGDGAWLEAANSSNFTRMTLQATTWTSTVYATQAAAEAAVASGTIYYSTADDDWYYYNGSTSILYTRGMRATHPKVFGILLFGDGFALFDLTQAECPPYFVYRARTYTNQGCWATGMNPTPTTGVNTDQTILRHSHGVFSFPIGDGTTNDDGGLVAIDLAMSRWYRQGDERLYEGELAKIAEDISPLVGASVFDGDNNVSTIGNGNTTTTLDFRVLPGAPVDPMARRPTMVLVCQSNSFTCSMSFPKGYNKEGVFGSAAFSIGYNGLGIEIQARGRDMTVRSAAWSDDEVTVALDNSAANDELGPFFGMDRRGGNADHHTSIVPGFGLLSGSGSQNDLLDVTHYRPDPDEHLSLVWGKWHLWPWLYGSTAFAGMVVDPTGGISSASVTAFGKLLNDDFSSYADQPAMVTAGYTFGDGVVFVPASNRVDVSNAGDDNLEYDVVQWYEGTKGYSDGNGYLLPVAIRINLPAFTGTDITFGMGGTSSANLNNSEEVTTSGAHFGVIIPSDADWSAQDVHVTFDDNTGTQLDNLQIAHCIPNMAQGAGLNTGGSIHAEGDLTLGFTDSGVGYVSGFSSTKYLTQWSDEPPVMDYARWTSALSTQFGVMTIPPFRKPNVSSTIFEASGTNGSMRLYVDASGYLRCFMDDGTNSFTLGGTAGSDPILTTTFEDWMTVTIIQTADQNTHSTFYMIVNGALRGFRDGNWTGDISDWRVDRVGIKADDTEAFTGDIALMFFWAPRVNGRIGDVLKHHAAISALLNAPDRASWSALAANTSFSGDIYEAVYDADVGIMFATVNDNGESGAASGQHAIDPRTGLFKAGGRALWQPNGASNRYRGAMGAAFGIQAVIDMTDQELVIKMPEQTFLDACMLRTFEGPKVGEYTDHWQTTDATPTEVSYLNLFEFGNPGEGQFVQRWKVTVEARGRGEMDGANNNHENIGLYDIDVITHTQSQQESGVSSLIQGTVTTVYEEAAAWDLTIALASGGTDRLVVTATGDANFPVNWTTRWVRVDNFPIGVEDSGVLR